MTLRAVLYARYSSAEHQSPKSTADQLHDCRRHAERLGAQVVAEFRDEGISAVAMSTRPGVLALLDAARALPRGVDLVITDELSRLTRDGGHSWDLFYELQALGIAIDTPLEGRVNEMTIGLKGTMNALERKNTAHRVRRGLSGVARDGRYPSRPPYGYRRVRVYDEATGEPIRGVIEPDPVTAPIVRRVLAELLAGSTAHQVALRLNGERVPGPRGGVWEVSAISGHRRTAHGIARNPLYAGEIVWNVTTQPKDRKTGKVIRRINPPEDWVRVPAPQLALVDRATWDALQAEMDRRADLAVEAGALHAANRPKRLFSGLVRCGICGSGMQTSGKGHRYRCLGRSRKGPAFCTNSVGADPDKLEAEALDLLTRDLLHPETIDAFVKELHAATARKQASAASRREALEAALLDAASRADRFLEQVADGLLKGKAVTDKLAALEARRADLEAQLQALAAEPQSADVLTLHPRAADRYRQLVTDLRARLEARPQADTPAHDQARLALRQVIRAIHLQPDADRTQRTNKPGLWTLRVEGDLAALFTEATAAQAATPTRRRA